MEEEVWRQQQEVWHQLFAKAKNTERLTQEILTRPASRDAVHCSGIYKMVDTSVESKKENPGF